MTPRVVLVHGIRTSVTMWRPQLEHLARRGVPAVAVELPGHGARMAEPFTLEESLRTIDDAVRRTAEDGPVLLVGHSFGGLLSIQYAGARPEPPIAGFVAASCTAIPHGAGLHTYRALARAVDALPNHGLWVTDHIVDRQLSEQARADFSGGGYAFAAQDTALASLERLDLRGALPRIGVPLWFVNGQFDQLRVNERLFLQLAPEAELVVIPHAGHLAPSIRPALFCDVLDRALATIGG